MLQKGSIVQARLIEALDQDHWIVSFQGRLIQVKNSTPIEFKENLLLNLKVKKTSPVELVVVSESSKRGLSSSWTI